MQKKIVNSGKTLPKFRQTGKTLKRVNPKDLGKLLGAEVVSSGAAKGGSPASLFALRQYFLENLRSSGGRPAVEENTRRQKIPISEETWQALIRLANILRADGIPISAGQMASAILRQGLAQFLPIALGAQSNERHVS